MWRFFLVILFLGAPKQQTSGIGISQIGSYCEAFQSHFLFVVQDFQGVEGGDIQDTGRDNNSTSSSINRSKHNILLAVI